MREAARAAADAEVELDYGGRALGREGTWYRLWYRDGRSTRQGARRALGLSGFRGLLHPTLRSRRRGRRACGTWTRRGGARQMPSPPRTRMRPNQRQGVLFSATNGVRAHSYPSAVPAAVDFVSQAAPADWRSRERSRQSIAHQLHRAAAADLACAEPLWALVPADGPVDDLLSARHQTAVPSIHLSRAAARLAVWACIAEMATRRGAIGWVDDSLSELIASHQDELPDLAESWRVPIAESLPRLSAAAGALEQVPDDELARLTGRTYEFGLTTSWIFRDRTVPPERVWHVWRAKQSGCFFTPEFVARHLAAVAITAILRRARAVPAARRRPTGVHRSEHLSRGPPIKGGPAPPPDRSHGAGTRPHT